MEYEIRVNVTQAFLGFFCFQTYVLKCLQFIPYYHSSLVTKPILRALNIWFLSKLLLAEEKKVYGDINAMSFPFKQTFIC